MSLSELKIISGETLVVTEGKLPPKVFQHFKLLSKVPQMLLLSELDLLTFTDPSFLTGFPDVAHVAVSGASYDGNRTSTG